MKKTFIFTLTVLFILCACTVVFADDAVNTQETETVEAPQAEEIAEDNSVKDEVASEPAPATESTEVITTDTETATENVAETTVENAETAVEEVVTTETTETLTTEESSEPEQAEENSEKPVKEEPAGVVVHIIKVDGGYVKVIGDVYDANSPAYFSTEYPEIPEGASVVTWEEDPRWDFREPIPVVTEIHIIKLPDGTYDVVYGSLDNPLETEHCDTVPELPEDVPTIFWDEDPRVVEDTPVVTPTTPEKPDYSGIKVSYNGNKVTITNAKFRTSREVWKFIQSLNLSFDIDTIEWRSDNGVIHSIYINFDDEDEEDVEDENISEVDDSSEVTVEITETEEIAEETAPKAEETTVVEEEETSTQETEEPKKLPSRNMFLIGDAKAEEKFYADFSEDGEEDNEK
jgi:RNA binding exosome subunit